MNAKKHDRLQTLCRACLKPAFNVNGADSTACNANSLLTGNLGQIFLHFTNMDVTKEAEIFPKLLCHLCVNKLLEYDKFCKLTMQSTASLYELTKADQEEDDIACPNNEIIVKSEHISDHEDDCASMGRDSDYDHDKTLQPHNEMSLRRENISDDEERASIKLEETDTENDLSQDFTSTDDDDKLLLPELANLPLDLKPQPYCETGHMNNKIVRNETVDNGNLAYGANYTGSGDKNTPSPSKSYENRNSNSSLSMSPTKQDRNSKKSVYCTYCNKQFYKEFYLDAHIRGVHMGEKEPFQCLLCFKSFTGYNQLYLHKRSKHGKVAIDVIKHRMNQMKRHLMKPTETNAKANGGVWDNTTSYNCAICSRNYSSRRALSEHLKRHQQIKEHTCRFCGVAKVTRTELLTHMRIHQPDLEKFQCPQCPQVFNHKNAISRHVKVVHEGQRRFVCSYCPRKFSTRNAQICHERLHTGERPFSCTICSKGFVQQESLRSHMKNHDKTLRTHVCSYCSQRFITRKNLIDHEQRHKGDKPHICFWCSKGFRTFEDLNAHRSTCGSNESTRNDGSITEQSTDSNDTKSSK
uniref:Protein krueppel n=1 Tax=Stomoxys calcitrans TaxID=35570 RepID=A0A1I8NZK6_STOCA